MRRVLALASLCLLALTCLGACKSARLVEPSPILLAQPQPEMRTLILRAMQRRRPGWRMQSEDPSAGRMRARIEMRNRHSATIDISYTDSQVSFQHVESHGLKETFARDGEKKVHRNYNSWLANLKADIEEELHLARSNTDPSSSGQ